MHDLRWLLQWQWLAYWRRILRGGTAAKTNLLVLGLLAAAGFARYLTFLQDAVKQAKAGNASLLELLVAGILLMLLQPGWDAGKLALGERELARFPLAGMHRFGMRVLSRFIPPVSWVFVLVWAAGIWPVLALPRPAFAATAYLLLTGAVFAAGLALSDLSRTAKAILPVRLIWLGTAAAGGLWWVFLQTVPPLPSHLVIAAGRGQLLAVLITFMLAAIACYAAWLALPWMLSQSPPAERSRQARSARQVSLFRREMRLQSKLTEIRTAWVISAALAIYLVSASHPEPDALRVMLGVLAFFSVGVAMNSFGLDGAPGVDRFLLLPVESREIILPKNQVFAIASAGPAILLAVLAALRFGWREGTADLLEALALCFAALAWGNITSVRRPERGDGAAGNVIDQFIAMAAIGLTTAAAIGALRGAGASAPAYVFGLAAIFGALYLISLWWSARYFTRNYERIRAEIS